MNPDVLSGHKNLNLARLPIPPVPQTSLRVPLEIVDFETLYIVAPLHKDATFTIA